jgi:phosphomethylpyrimidine synthase
MKITQEVREYAEEHGLGDEKAIAEGMDEMSKTFKDKGSAIYHEAGSLKED